MSRLLPVALAIGLVSWAGIGSSRVAAQELPRITWNDNVDPAGSIVDGVLELDLEIVEGVWHVLGDDEPGGRVLGFAEVGKGPSNPGPMIRVQRGTQVRVSVVNRADTVIVVHGFGDRQDGEVEPLRVEPDETATRTFTADVEGTYFYWGSFHGRPLAQRAFEDSQLTGAFVVGVLLIDHEIPVVAILRRGRRRRAVPPDQDSRCRPSFRRELHLRSELLRGVEAARGELSGAQRR